MRSNIVVAGIGELTKKLFCEDISVIVLTLVEISDLLNKVISNRVIIGDKFTRFGA